MAKAAQKPETGIEAPAAPGEQDREEGIGNDPEANQDEEVSSESLGMEQPDAAMDPQERRVQLQEAIDKIDLEISRLDKLRTATVKELDSILEIVDTGPEHYTQSVQAYFKTQDEERAKQANDLGLIAALNQAPSALDAARAISGKVRAR